jgi:hypothetical protein
LGGLVAILALIHVAIGRLAFTGDEVGYTFQGLGLFTNAHYYATAATWSAFLHANGLASAYPGEIVKPYQTLGPSIVYGAVLATFGLEAARWLNFIVGCAGLALLLIVLKSVAGNDAGRQPLAAYAALALVALSVPFVAYLKLLYSETLLFAIVAAALACLVRGRRLLAVAFAVILPFVHIRALPMAVALFGVVELDEIADRSSPAALGKQSLVFLAGIAAFAGYQYATAGSFAGTAFSTYAPSFVLLPERLGMQLFGVHHGILIYAPLFLAGFVGLLIGARQRNRLCAYASIVLAAYGISFVWSEAGESWPGRFWIAAIPFVAVGILYWLRSSRGWPSFLPVIPLAGLGLVMLALFIAQPLWFLESRRVCVPYEIVAQIVPFDLGLYLPVDTNVSQILPYVGSIPILLAVASAFGALLWICNSKGEKLRRFACAGALAILTGIALLSFVRPLPRSAYRIEPRPDGIVVRLRAPYSISAIRFDDKIASIWPITYPRRFEVTCLRGSTVASDGAPVSRPLVLVPSCRDSDAIDLRGEPVDAAREFLRNAGNVTLLQRAF